ncbi:tagatose-1,6-bisphosphate aldolase [Neobacillus niacini]|nr:tagatose-1,6-bisphosphate aldolase [Neobacillus niacini]
MVTRAKQAFEPVLIRADESKYLQTAHKVIEAMREFSKAQYQVDVLKVEVLVDMNFVEGYAEGETDYSQEEAATYFKEQSEATELPFIFLVQE